jgi:hypothetical protein
LRAIAGFRDWNPTRFLDTAELTHAMAIGYDWLHGALSPDDREMVRDAIVQKGLDPAMPIYERQISWTNNHYYWNPVCNGAVTMGALAVAEDDMQKCEALVRFAVDSLPRALATYGSDGGWPEGDTYWNYATRYVGLMVASLESATGTDFGLGGGKRLERTGRFRVYTTGPNYRVFNFGDAGEDDGSVPEMFWLAKHTNQPAFAWQEARHIDKTGRSEPLDLVWYERDQRIPSGPAWPLDAVFPGLGLATFRSSWEDPDALFRLLRHATTRLRTRIWTLGVLFSRRAACAGRSIWDRMITDRAGSTRDRISAITGRGRKRTIRSRSMGRIKMRAAMLALRGTSRRRTSLGFNSIWRTPIPGR